MRRQDATTERDIALHQKACNAQALQDAAKFARRVRQRLGLSQFEFSQRIEVSLETILNWEQGKRSPSGAAKALPKVLDRAPEAALPALGDTWMALACLPGPQNETGNRSSVRVHG